MTARLAHAVHAGATVHPDGVRFRLWAPDQAAVTLLIEPAHAAQALPMERTNDGWFDLDTDAAHAGTRYVYVLENGLHVPDPASRFQPDGVHAASEVIDPRAYAWEHPQWRGRPWRDAVIYEAHVGTFCPAGDYDGMRLRLGHLADLGVTALELMPLGAFDGLHNWGYDGVLPFAPHAAYGRPEALKQLVDAAHAHGLMVLLDVVYNHFGPSGNYLGVYASPFFTDRWHTPWGQAIDFSHAEVRRFFIDNALYWLEEFRFDGLRLDAADHIHDAGEPHILAELAATVHARTAGRHIHLLLENDHNAVRWLEDRSTGRSDPRGYAAQWNDDFHHAAHVLATGEDRAYYADYAQQPIEAFSRALAEGFIYQGEYSAWRKRKRGEPSAALPPLAFVNFLQNHDQVGNRAFGERLTDLADADAIEAMTAIWLLAPSVPMFFMGEEWGARQPFLYFCDYQGEIADAVREGRRREFEKFAAPGEARTSERVPDPNAGSTFTASVLNWGVAATPRARRRLEFVRQLLALRRTAIQPHLNGELHGGTYALAGDAMHVEWTLADGVHLHLAANPSPRPATAVDWMLPGKRLYARPANPDAGVIAQLPSWSVLWSLA